MAPSEYMAQSVSAKRIMRASADALAPLIEHGPLHSPWDEDMPQCGEVSTDARGVPAGLICDRMPHPHRPCLVHRATDDDGKHWSWSE